jgi:tRNA threonylcarbamoyladenosine biosynthesis protein TsaB
MDETRSTERLRGQAGGLLLAIDTCGPTGSVALGRVNRQLSGQLSGEAAETLAVEILGQIEMEGRSYSATLVAAVGELLGRTGTRLGLLDAIAAVNGPGSFTGVRVGLAAVKGLAEAERIPVVAVSRLEVLAATAGVLSAALDAHRHEVFLRLAEPGEQGRELLAGADELGQFAPPSRIALCDEAAALLLGSAWPAAELVRAAPPNAADALLLCASRAAAGQFVDLALLDGHYLRRSDAEIFGEPAAAPERP